jgi:DNA-directed RNA polymerase specialized sigma24 family protein
MSMDEAILSFDEIHEAYRPKIRRYLARMVGEDEAEDLTQEVFVKIHRALNGFKGDSKLSTWIYRIATNAALDKLRSPSFQRTEECAPLTEKTGLEGQAVFEIARILGLSPATVKIRLHRGRERLLRELKAHCRPEDWL